MCKTNVKETKKFCIPAPDKGLGKEISEDSLKTRTGEGQKRGKKSSESSFLGDRKKTRLRSKKAQNWSFLYKYV